MRCAFRLQGFSQTRTVLDGPVLLYETSPAEAGSSGRSTGSATARLSICERHPCRARSSPRWLRSKGLCRIMRHDRLKWCKMTDEMHGVKLLELTKDSIDLLAMETLGLLAGLHLRACRSSYNEMLQRHPTQDLADCTCGERVRPRWIQFIRRDHDANYSNERARSI